MRLADEWRVWVASNLLRGATPADVTEALGTKGVSAEEAEACIREIQASHAFVAARPLLRDARRHEQVLRLQNDVSRAIPRAENIERRAKLSADEFFERYYARNAPVIVTDVVSTWPAVTKWTPEYLRERAGDLEVEVSMERDKDPDYDMHTAQLSQKTLLRDFVERVLAAGETNDFYMVARNFNLDRGPLHALFEDVPLDPTFFDTKRLRGCSALWFGPSGTITPLHHDTSNILFCQIYGRKRLTLASPLLPWLWRGARGVYAPKGADPENPDFDAFPEVREYPFWKADLEPGEALFIPVGWWHHVRALSVSISVALTNFTKPNFFDWYKPGLV